MNNPTNDAATAHTDANVTGDVPEEMNATDNAPRIFNPFVAMMAAGWNRPIGKVRSGVTKNKGRGQSKARRKMAKASRRKNRGK